ncbi:hypothetical protein ACFQ1E_11370 [Sphingomonas canadensis]|uniref:Sugar transporter n=1 Tax=Sphingomonas canadensis TaxID=1219257 RepID=A0ABW3H645_9SPHN|nr:hypothetical protein [Sphingomonas canadensis]MCW3836279.1 hypothetical protein [Sphingomonas canadensis]
MSADFRPSPPRWFVAVAAALLLWGMTGCMMFYLHIAFGPAMDPQATDWDRAYYAALPGWFTPVYAVAVVGALLGSLALLLRSRWAVPLYVLSLAGVVIQFGYVLLGTGLIAHKGAMTVVPLPLVIVAVAGFQLWLARRAAARGWIW